jgi:hypothetical protein
VNGKMMSPEQREQFKELITTKCEEHLAKGGKIICFSFGRDNCYCPIACLTNGSSAKIDRQNVIQSELGFAVDDVLLWNLIHSFDGKPLESTDEDNTYFTELGTELRAKYIKIESQAPDK